ncbi:RagB/SusD family nutrient uptake outer membrane protein [Flavobacterium sp.]|uniref:RagB/SusD family nutrient uptake outer membrane protein n=1 Tax=Flavobacterium sp. TaxID=239 RepID=UPI0037535E3D
MKRKNLFKGFLYLSLVSFGVSCTDLEEEVLDGESYIDSSGTTNINPSAVLESAYNGLRDFNGQGLMYAMDELSTDAMVGPTRGGDWDDNGSWRQLHTHTWAPDHVEVRGAWNSLLSNVYNCNLVIESSTVTPSQLVQARFLRAFYYYNVIDLFGQVPYRPAGSSLLDDPKVWTRTEATTFVISELEAILPTLPARVTGDASIANIDAGHFLLAKLYLNKSVFLGSSFAAGDMTKVVQHVDAMTNSLSANYWNNFAPNNNTSNEVVFSSKNIQGGAGGNMQSKWRMGTHYNQTPSGWNGFATVSEYYNRFGSTDTRAKYSTPSIISNIGNPVGFNVGQQYAPGGVTPLLDRNNNPLFFTPALTLITDGLTLETAGIRGMKYIPDPGNQGNPDNDLVLMRYSDALLMKVEAILRGGSGSAGTILADIATRSGVAAAPNTLDGVYLERGRELWWEGHRRNDMIRFGTFLNSRELKPYNSDPKFTIYPIPADALFNANLKQNPGY